MRFQNVCLESLGYTLPDEIVTSAEIERRLQPLYERLRLPEGRLELMTGIRERRFWPPGTLPSTKSIESGEQALAAAGIDRSLIGALVHGSVCRDHLEPATACAVHHGLQLSEECAIYDVSNACLGLLNGMLQIANMIELGQIRAGMVVGTESSRPLVETTIRQLNQDPTLTRAQMKLAVASLTIGSGSCAMVLVDRELSRTGTRLTTGVSRAFTAHHELCHNGSDDAVGAGMAPLMDTDSERLLLEGVAAARRTFEGYLAETGWTRDQIDKTFCHQVGSAHKRLLFEQLSLSPSIDFPTVETLGNMGSVSLPITMAQGIEQGLLSPQDKVALLGIGSGINVIMAAVEWQTTTANLPRRTFPAGQISI